MCSNINKFDIFKGFRRVIENCHQLRPKIRKLSIEAENTVLELENVLYTPTRKKTAEEQEHLLTLEPRRVKAPT